MKKNITSFFVIALTAISTNAFAGGATEFEKQDWAFSDFRGQWDKATLTRGLQVATEVCMSCHSLKFTPPRALQDVGFSETEVKGIAADLGIKVTEVMQSAMSDADAKEFYGKELPDLSLINRARLGGADYVYAILTKYEDEVPVTMDMDLPEGAYFNHAFAGHAIAMPPPLSDGQVKYADGTEATTEQMAKDVTYFLEWTSKPELKRSQHLGVYVLLYLAIMAALLYMLKRRIWKKVH